MIIEGANVNQRRRFENMFLRGGEAVTSSTKRVPTAATEHVRKAIQNAPECTAKEVPKRYAIRALLPDIEQLQSNGYDWETIVSLLSEHGIAIHVVTLKSYLQRVKAENVRPHRNRTGGKQTEPRTPRGSAEETRRGTAKAGEARTKGRSEGTPESLAVAPKEAAVDASKASGTTAKEAASRPWSFVPEEDTDDTRTSLVLTRRPLRGGPAPRQWHPRTDARPV